MLLALAKPFTSVGILDWCDDWGYYPSIPSVSRLQVYKRIPETPRAVDLTNCELQRSFYASVAKRQGRARRKEESCIAGAYCKYDCIVYYCMWYSRGHASFREDWCRRWNCHSRCGCSLQRCRRLIRKSYHRKTLVLIPLFSNLRWFNSSKLGKWSEDLQDLFISGDVLPIATDSTWRNTVTASSKWYIRNICTGFGKNVS